MIKRIYVLEKRRLGFAFVIVVMRSSNWVVKQTEIKRTFTYEITILLNVMFVKSILETKKSLTYNFSLVKCMSVLCNYRHKRLSEFKSH